METLLRHRIKQIHESDLYGSVIELGTGCCVANALMSVEGATKTIYECKVPYSKKSQETYKFTGRSVSGEAIKKIILAEYMNEDKPLNTNFCLATSFQLQGDGQTNLTHGYIGLAHKGNAIIYHISIPEFESKTSEFDDDLSVTSRETYLEKIAELAVEILYSSLKEKLPVSEYIDTVMNLEGEEDIESTLQTLANLNNVADSGGDPKFVNFDNFLTFSPEHKMIRFEDLMRGKPGLILLKGSFNPIHDRHVEMIEEAKKLYPDYAVAFSSSIERRDKEDMTIPDLIERIKKINSLGYFYCVNNGKYFVDAANWIRRRWKQPIIFPVGLDTANRWIEDEVKLAEQWESSIKKDEIMKFFINYSLKDSFKNAKFLVFPRKDVVESKNTKYFKDYLQSVLNSEDATGISSTKIRQGLMQTNI